MTLVNEDSNSQSLEQQVNQLSTRVEQLEKQLEKVLQISTKIEKIEEDLMLVSDVSRYAKLRSYLQDKRWFDADIETINLIMAILGHSRLEELKPEEIQMFPCNSLRVIDNLWLKYSQGRFGFSVQLEIYKNCGGDREATIAQNQKIVETWGEKLGWRADNKWLRCESLDFSLKAPLGCHPSQWWNSPYGSKMTNYFLARLMSCGFLNT
ncbi:MAG: GUN4 domain-containing protein [Cyanobacteriota bacterium]|nr:GUN4 domain-containing protein [Cyanobacteriota bacterium]